MKVYSNDVIKGLLNIFFVFKILFIFFIIYIKMTRQASAKYYQKSREKIKKSSPERYQNLSEEE